KVLGEPVWRGYCRAQAFGRVGHQNHGYFLHCVFGGGQYRSSLAIRHYTPHYYPQRVAKNGTRPDTKTQSAELFYRRYLQRPENYQGQGISRGTAGQLGQFSQGVYGYETRLWGV